MNFVIPDFYPAATEIFMAVMVLVSLLASVFTRDREAARSLAYMLTQGSVLGAAVIVVSTMQLQTVLTFSGLYVADGMSSFLKLMICLVVIVSLLYSRDYLALRRIDRPDFYLLIQLMTLGMMVLASAAHLLTIYLGLEMMSLSLYALVAFDRDNVRASEAAMKYFVLGALASGLLLYGMSMIYGATGSMQLSVLAGHSWTHELFDGQRTVLAFGLVFIVAGLAFKLGAVPFHMWVPDVYQGAPTAVTLMIAAAPKLAAFAMAMRLLVFGLVDLSEYWQSMLLILACASIVLGNLAAIAQKNIKRMLAYSGVSHMGFVLLALAAGGTAGRLSIDNLLALDAYSAAMFYAITYALMTLASFGIIILLSREGVEAEELDNFKGLNQRSPWFAAMMMFVMFSMAGIPFFVGFISKLAVLQAVVRVGWVWVAVLVVIMSVIGLFYYLRVVKLMYFDAPEDQSKLQACSDMRFMLSVNGLGIAVLGLAPEWLLSMCMLALLPAV